MNNLDKGEIHRLISLIEPHPAIWNPRLKEVGLKEQRAAAWQHIAKEMEKPVESIKSCWTSLRDYYQRYKRRWNSRSSPGPSGSAIKPPWPFADQLRFLDSCEVESRRVADNLADFLRSRAAILSQMEIPPVLKAESPVAAGDVEDLSHSEFPSMVRMPTGQQLLTPPHWESANPPQLDGEESTPPGNFQSFWQPDSDGLFGASVAARLRQISSAVTRSQVRVAVEQILLRAELIDADQKFRSTQY